MPDFDPYRLALSVTDSSARVTRWGPDEPDGRNVPLDLEFTTSLPGGYTDLTCALLREARRSNADNNLADRVQLYGPGNDPAFDGFFSSFPKDQGQIAPAAVGWSAVLGFDTGFQMPYVDRDARQWTDGGVAAQTSQNASFQDMRWSTELGGFICTLPGTLGAQASMAELWYQAPPGVTIAKVAFIGQDSNMPAAWEVPRLVFGDVVGVRTDTYAVTFDNALHTQAPTTNRRCLMWRVYNNAIAATPTLPAYRKVTAIAVYGNHGLTTRAIDASTPDGIYGCDAAADVVTRCAPMLNFTTGAGGSIEPNSVIIPHLVFREPTKAQDALAKISGFGITPLVIPEWGVYDNKQFFWRSPDSSRRCWQARIADGAKPKLSGDQLSDRFNGVLVRFTDPQGYDRVVGPPAAYWYGGTALADATDPTLVDTSSTNPINAHGIPQKWAILQLSDVATQAAAIALGGVFLQVQSQPQRRGQVELTGLLTHPTIAQPQAVYKVRAGDYVQITDSNEKDVKRRIIGTRYSHATRSVLCDLDSTPFTLDALLELIGADLVGSVG